MDGGSVSKSFDWFFKNLNSEDSKKHCDVCILYWIFCILSNLSSILTGSTFEVASTHLSHWSETPYQIEHLPNRDIKYPQALTVFGNFYNCNEHFGFIN